MEREHKRHKRSKGIYIEDGQQLFRSPAWLSLGGAATKIFSIFLTKRRLEKVSIPGKPHKRNSQWRIANNDEIEFTYLEAKEKYGISQQRFLRGIDELVDRGFVDIAISGKGYGKQKTLYGLHGRWKEWGTDRFLEQHRVKAAHGFGFSSMVRVKKNGKCKWVRRESMKVSKKRKKRKKRS